MRRYARLNYKTAFLVLLSTAFFRRKCPIGKIRNEILKFQNSTSKKNECRFQNPSGQRISIREVYTAVPSNEISKRKKTRERNFVNSSKF
jgi:hypothetical protein